MPRLSALMVTRELDKTGPGRWFDTDGVIGWLMLPRALRLDFCLAIADSTGTR